MDIHAPESPIGSFKDFAIHIAVVTCGILIALGLEGLREAVHNRALVRETRENIRLEMQANRQHEADELPRVKLYAHQLQTLSADLPVIGIDHPEQVRQRLATIVNPGYFFVSSSWQAALSTGALEHMGTEEAIAYGGAAQVIAIYTGLQTSAETEETRTLAFFRAHPHPTPDQLEQGTEHLLLFARAEQALAFVGPQMQAQIDRALSAAEKH